MAGSSRIIMCASGNGTDKLQFRLGLMEPSMPSLCFPPNREFCSAFAMADGRRYVKGVKHDSNLNPAKNEKHIDKDWILKGPQGGKTH